MFLQLGVELAPILNILLWKFWKLGCRPLLLFFGVWSHVDLESRSGDTHFLACWWEEDEIPLFLELGDGINSATILE